MTAPHHVGPPTRLPWFEVRLPRARGDFTWIYLWGAPLRFSHWLSALSLVVLFATGIFISQPLFVTNGEASSHFLMGRFRFTHFLAASILIMGGIIRVYWLFAGNEFERWSALWPFTRLVHVWSAPVWYLGRKGYQIVRTRGPISNTPAERTK